DGLRAGVLLRYLARQLIRGRPNHIAVAIALADPATGSLGRVEVEPVVDGLGIQRGAIRHDDEVEEREHRCDGGHGAAALGDGVATPVVATERGVLGMSVFVGAPAGVVLSEVRTADAAIRARGDLSTARSCAAAPRSAWHGGCRRGSGRGK